MESLQLFGLDATETVCVDHVEGTYFIRGLLCYSCNIAIGRLNHEPELLRKAAVYCERKPVLLPEQYQNMLEGFR